MFIESNQKPSSARMMGIATNVVIGCFNCGFVLAGTLDVIDVWNVQFGWGDKSTRNNTVISTCAVLGLTLGSIFSKLITNFGRRRAILISNVIITLITIPYFFTKNFWVIASTRFVFGIAAAFIINASSLYISETIPVEFQSKVGISINLGICSGIFITQLFGLLLPTKDQV